MGAKALLHLLSKASDPRSGFLTVICVTIRLGESARLSRVGLVLCPEPKRARRGRQAADYGPDLHDLFRRAALYEALGWAWYILGLLCPPARG
jgi:hypothetical protein